MRVGRKPGWSLTRRLVWLLMLILLVIGTLQIGFVYRALLKEADEVFDAQLKQAAQALVLTTPTQTTALVSPEAGKAEELDLLIRERGSSGELRSTVDGVFPEQVPLGFADLQTSLGEIRVFTARRADRDVSVGQRLAARRELAREIAFSALWPLSFLAVAGLLLLYLIVRSVLAPVTELERQIGRRDPSALTPIVDPGLPLELSPLLIATNGLLKRLSKALEHQRRFLADAAHELRTPIAAIGLQNTLVARADSDQERQLALEVQGAGIRRASALVDQLMRLSRLETADAPLQVAELDLIGEIQGLVDLHSSESEAKHICIELTGAAVSVHADAGLFSAVIGNLMGNAVRHCPPGSKVVIESTACDSLLVITIDDNGPGIPEGDLRAMLRPFHRSAASGTPGSGLGLAIVQAACERAGWTLNLSRSPLGGLRASVQLAPGNA